MGLTQLTIETTKEKVDLVSEVLIGFGSLSITLSDTNDDAIYEPPVGETPLWESTTINAIFESCADMKYIQEMLLQLCSVEQSEYKVLIDKVWEDECKIDFKAMQFGELLWVCPSWEDSSLLPKDTVIIDMDPGLAFGTGTHETTSLCLEYLDKNPPKGLSVIDYGSGTGILAIAAAKLGASHVVAVDNDRQAIIATTSNILKNNLKHSIDVVHVDEESMSEKVDLLIANILANPLVELCTHFSDLIKLGGKLTISGILEEQLETVIETYNGHFKDLVVTKKGIWCRVDGVKS
jgi:ribosomal protein L11 methyltransferase